MPVKCVELLLISKLPWLHIIPANAFHTGGIDAYTFCSQGKYDEIVQQWCDMGGLIGRTALWLVQIVFAAGQSEISQRDSCPVTPIHTGRFLDGTLERYPPCLRRRERILPSNSSVNVFNT